MTESKTGTSCQWTNIKCDRGEQLEVICPGCKQKYKVRIHTDIKMEGCEDG